MAIQTKLKQSFIIWNSLYLVITAGLGVWGAYDYWVTIPDREVRFEQFTELKSEYAALDTKAIESGIHLEGEDLARHDEIENIIKTKFDDSPPMKPAVYDRPLNFWVYFIGCGVLSAPWFLWKLITKRRTGPALKDDGSLVTEKATYPAEKIDGIDMSKWMSKSTAKVQVKGEEKPLLLDDYVYEGTYLLVGALAHRFYPEEWTEEAKSVKKEEEDASEEIADDAVETTEESHDKDDHDPDTPSSS
jgi:hypothetical protein